MEKIVVTVRTRNNQNQIERFINSYQWADAIIVADGGSTDNTVEVASNMPKTFVYHFNERYYNGDFWRNPHGKHINFLIHIAEDDFDADWIIFDDSDCIPNYYVREHARDFLRYNSYVQMKNDVVNVTRIYIKGSTLHYPNLAKPINNNWSPSLWAWRRGMIYAKEDNPLVHEFNDFSNLRTEYWMPPACLLHYFYPDEKTMNKKLEFYEGIGEIPGVKHPRDYAGGLEYLPEWACE